MTFALLKLVFVFDGEQVMRCRAFVILAPDVRIRLSISEVVNWPITALSAIDLPRKKNASAAAIGFVFLRWSDIKSGSPTLFSLLAV